jgi:RHS repeat-associated protein
VTRPAASPSGRISSITTANGATTTYTYNLGAKSTTVTDPLSNSTTTTYDDDGNPIEVVNPSGGVTQSTYDSNDDLLSQTVATPQGNLTTTYTYDQFSDVTSQTNPDGTTTSATYNNFGQVLSQTDSQGNTTSYRYDQNGNLVSSFDPQAGQTTYRYDINGNLVGSTDPLGNGTAYTVNGSGQVLRESDPGSLPTSNTYDANGNQTGTSSTWVDPNNPADVRQLTTSTQYDADGNVTSQTDAEGHTSSTTYTPDGQVATTTASNGDVTQNVYDAAGNLIETREQSRDSSGNLVWQDTLSVYDADGRVIAQTDSFVEGSSAPITGTVTTYDGLGDVTQTQSVSGIQITITGGGGNVHSVLTAPGTVLTASTTQYDNQGRELSSTDQYGHETLTTYDQLGRVVDSRTQSVDQNGNVVWLVARTVYNAQGQVELATDQYQEGSSTPVNATETIYDQLGRAVQTIRLQGVQVGLFNANTGAPVNPLNPGNAAIVSRVTSWGTQLYSTKAVYNSLGQVVQSVAEDGQVTNYEYDSLGRQTAQIGQAVAPASVGIAVPTGDPAGTLVSLRTETAYDANGNAATQTTNLYQFILPNGTTQIDRTHAQITQYQYDQFGKVLKTIYPDNSTTSATYDSFGNTLTSTDQLGQTTQYQYDAENRLIKVTLPAVTNPATGKVVNPTYQYAYDAQGNQTNLTDPNGGQTTFTYDAQGNETSRTLPLGQTETFGYDAQGREIEHTDFEGNVTDSVFASDGFLSALDEFAVGHNPSTSAPDETVAYQYDALGRTVETTDSSGTTFVVYDAQGDRTQVSSPEGVLNYVYDDFGRVVQRFTSAAASPDTPVNDFRYTYDALGRLASVTVDERNGVMLSTPETTTYQYDLLGGLIRQTAPNGVVTTYAYNSTGHVTTIIDTGPGGAKIDEYDYTYRADSLESGATETLWQNGTAEVTTIAWTYDADDRLTQEVYNSFDASLSSTTTYTYDLDGNRVSEQQLTAAGSETTVDTYDANDRLIAEVQTGNVGQNTTTTYQYGGASDAGTEQTLVTVADAESGTLVEQDHDTYNLQGMLSGAVIDKYSAAGTLTEQDTATYTYDSDNNRVGETDEVQVAGTGNPSSLVVQSNTTTSDLVDNNNPTGYSQIVEQVTRDATSGAVVKDLVFTLGLQVLAQASVTRGSGTSGTPLFLFFDTHGSTRLLLDGAAAIQAVYRYDAYGAAIGFDPSTAATSILYSGQRLDVLTGQYDNRAREYDPTTGTFTTLDPFAGDATDPLSYNKYLYTQGDPINGVDPSGRDSDQASLALLAMMTGGGGPLAIIPKGAAIATKADILRVIEKKRDEFKKFFPASLYRKSHLDDFFRMEIDAVKTQITAVVVDDTFDIDPTKGNIANYDYVKNIMYIHSLVMTDVSWSPLLHEVVHAVDAQHGWYLKGALTSDLDKGEGLAYGAEFILDSYERLMYIAKHRQSDGEKNFWASFNEFLGYFATHSYRQCESYTIAWQVAIPHLIGGPTLRQLNDADLADVKRKLGGLEFDYKLIASYFGLTLR